MIKLNPSKWEYLKESTLKRKPQGDHLFKGCEYWQKNRTIFSPEAS